jgi:thioredoxin-like negative regulator of GroEL
LSDVTTLDLGADRFAETIRDNDIVLAYFWSAGSGQCQQFTPAYEASASQHPDVVHGKVDIDAESALAESASIPVVPALLAFKGGELVFKQIGQLSSPGFLDDLVGQLKAYNKG